MSATFHQGIHAMHRLLLAVVAAALLWPADMPPAAAETPKAGRSVVTTFKDDLPTLDPAGGDHWQNLTVIKSLFVGLLEDNPATTVLVPDLAEFCRIPRHGQTKVFTL